MPQIAVITGSSAGVGRATAREFAAKGCEVALLSRNAERLASIARECRELGVRAITIPTDVADAQAVEAAAERVEGELGPIDVWVNVAMATVFAPVAALTAEEVERGTKVTYLGQVHGTMAALKRMRVRDRGCIVNVGSALAFRAIPLQSVYCGAKFAVRGFTEALRSELLHDRLNIHLCMVHLPAMNTPQFDWALNKMGKKARPMGRIFQPESAARAIWFAATHKRRDIWVGWPTAKVILASRIAPESVDRYLAKTGYSGQLTDESQSSNAPANLFHSVDGPYGAHGRFDEQASKRVAELLTGRVRNAVWGAGLGLLAGLGWWAARPRRRSY
jgi:short-subunit dehydrogenase